MKVHKGKIIDKVKNYKIVDCKNCGFVHIDPIPAKKELEKLYSTHYYADEKPQYIEHNLEDLKWWQTVYKDRIDFIEKFTSHPGAKKTGGKRMLEFGSGPGLFLKYAKKRGWKVLGIEASKQAIAFSKKNKIPVIDKFYEEVNPNDLGKFDAIVMFEFLEHVPDPAHVLKFSHKLLKPDGIISIGVPNDYNPLQRIVRKYLRVKPYWLAPPFHINYFTIDSLSKLLKKNGFKVVRKETNFPLEMFLLMDEIYVGNDKVGRYIHTKRKKFDLALAKLNNKLKLNLYEQFAHLDIGRDITVYGKNLMTGTW